MANLKDKQRDKRKYKCDRWILEIVKKYPHGIILRDVIKQTGFSRGTVKKYMTELVTLGDVTEVIYAQNTKVYYPNTGGYIK